MTAFLAPSHNVHATRGNILFLILIAIVLFAALAYAVTNMLRAGGKDAGQDKADLLASQLIENAGLIESTILRNQLMYNIPDWGFDFYRIGGGISANTNCTQAACKIFTDNGGTVPVITLPDWAMGSGTGLPIFYVTKVINVGTDTNDVLYGYSNISQTLCDAINRKLNQSADINMTTSDGIGSGSYTYTGALTAMPAATGALGDTNTTLVGKKAACYLAASNVYRFTYVIMER